MCMKLVLMAILPQLRISSSSESPLLLLSFLPVENCKNFFESIVIVVILIFFDIKLNLRVIFHTLRNLELWTDGIYHLWNIYFPKVAFEKCWAHSPLRAAARPFTRCHYWRRLRIDVHDDNDNAWQRGPLWPHGMGPITLPVLKECMHIHTSNFCCSVIFFARLQYCVKHR